LLAVNSDIERSKSCFNKNSFSATQLSSRDDGQTDRGKDSHQLQIMDLSEWKKRDIEKKVESLRRGTSKAGWIDRGAL